MGYEFVMINMCTKFEVYGFTCSKDGKDDTKLEIVPFEYEIAYDFLLTFHSNADATL